MTKEEAIYLLRNTAWLAPSGTLESVEEAIYMAIEALERTETHGVCSDAISRQAVIDATKTVMKDVLDSLPTTLVDGEEVYDVRTSELDFILSINKALQNAIKALPSADRPQAKWIPCSERLPKDGQGVLVTVDDNEFDIKVGSCIYSDGVFFSALYDLDVIAWMPLPDAWEGVG